MISVKNKQEALIEMLQDFDVAHLEGTYDPSIDEAELHFLNVPIKVIIAPLNYVVSYCDLKLDMNIATVATGFQALVAILKFMQEYKKELAHKEEYK